MYQHNFEYRHPETTSQPFWPFPGEPPKTSNVSPKVLQAFVFRTPLLALFGMLLPELDDLLSWVEAWMNTNQTLHRTLSLMIFAAIKHAKNNSTLLWYLHPQKFIAIWLRLAENWLKQLQWCFVFLDKTWHKMCCLESDQLFVMFGPLRRIWCQINPSHFF